MKKKVLSILIALCSTFATIGLASCDILSNLPDPDDYENVGTYHLELDSKEFNPIQVYDSKFDCTGLTLLYSQELNGEVFYETTIEVRPEMITQGGKTNSVGNKTVTISYHEETWTIDYTVKYQVDFLADGKAFDTQYVIDSSEIVVPTPLDRTADGYAFAYWKSEVPEKISGNVSIEAHYYDTKLEVPSLSALDRVYDPNATLKDIELPSMKDVGKWEFIDDLTTPVGGAGEHEFNVRFVPATDELAPVADSKVVINVAKQLVDKPTLETSVFTYDGTAKTVLEGLAELFTVSNNVQTNAGTYTVGLTLKDEENYAWSTKNPDPVYTIEKKLVTFTITEDTFEYNGEAHFPKYTVSDEALSKDSIVVSGNARVDAGKYSFRLNVNDPNYTGSYRGSFEITKPNVTIEVDSYEITYGEAIPDVTYTITGFEGDEALLNVETEKPSNSNAGEYSLVVKINNENVNVANNTPGTLTILKANLTTAPDPVLSTDKTAATYEDLLSSVTFAEAPLGTWVWKDPDIVIDSMEGITATAEFYSQNSNYNPYEKVLTITNIAKRELVIEITKNTYTYTGEAFKVEYLIKDKTTEGLTYTDLEISGNDEAVNADTYDRRLEIVSDCYKGSISTKLKINQATPEVELEFNEAEVAWKPGLTLGNSGIEPKGSGTGSYQWKNSGTALYGEEIGKENTYTVVYKPTEEDAVNYLDREFTFTLTVVKAQTEIVGVEETTEFTYNAKAQSLSARVNRDIENTAIISYQYKDEQGNPVDEMIDFGTYTVVITATETAHYVSVTREVTVTIKQVTNAWSQSPYMNDYQWAYGETAGTAYVSANFGSVFVTYKGKDTKGNDYEESTMMPTNAGKYQAIFTVVGTDNYTGLTATKDFEITKAAVAKPSLAKNEFVYTGSAPTLTIIESANSKDKYTFTQPTQTDVGGYSVTLTLTEKYSGNYEWADTKTNETTLGFAITKATIALTAWQNTSGWVYGEDVNLPYVQPTRSGGGNYAVPIVYSYSTSLNGTYTVIVENTFTSTTPADTYYIKASVADTSNYNGASTQEAQSFTIAKADYTEALTYTVNVPANLSWYNGLTIGNSGITLTCSGDVTGYAWVNASQALSAYNNTVKVKFTIDDNYNVVEEDVTITVPARIIPVPDLTIRDTVNNTVTNTAPTYNGKEWTPSVPSNSYYEVIETKSATNAGDVVSVTLKLNENCVWDDNTSGEKTLSYTIAKAGNAITALTIAGWTYDNGTTQPNPQLTATSKEGEITYEYRINGTTGDWLSAPVNAGIYDVKVSIAESANYLANEVTFYNVFEIEKATLEKPTLDQTSLVYNGAAQTVNVVIPTNATYTADWYTVSGNTATNVGEPKVTVTLTTEYSANYKWNDTNASATELGFTITSATIAFVWKNTSGWTYGETVNLPYAEITRSNGGEYIVPITYTYTDKDGEPVEEFTSETPAGTYTVIASVSGTGYNTATTETTFTVAKATVELPALPTGPLTYAEGYYQLIVTAGDKGLYTVAITTADNTDAGEYLGINAGTYTVTLTIDEFTNYKWENSDNQTLSYEYTIRQATLGYVHFANPEAVTWYSGLTLGNITLPTDYAWKDATTTALMPGTTSYGVVYTEPSENYKPVNGSVQVTVNKIKEVITNVNAAYNRTYTGETVVTLAPETVNEDAEVVYTFTHMTYDGSLSKVEQPTGNTFALKDAGIYDITISVAETTYYTAAEFRVRVTIAQATVDFDVTAWAGTASWDPEPRETLSTLTLPTSEYGAWSWAEGGNTVIDEVDANKTPTKHTLQFVSSNPNYRNSSKTVELTVDKALVVLEGIALTDPDTKEAVEATYSGKDITATITVETNKHKLPLAYGTDYIYTVDEVDSTHAWFTVKNAKTYKVVITLVGEAAEAYHFNQQSTDTYDLIIEEAEVAAPEFTAYTDNKTTFTGGAQIPLTLGTFDEVDTEYTVSIDDEAINYGEYTITVKFAENAILTNYKWTNVTEQGWILDAATNSLSYKYTIEKAIVTVDFAENQSFDYDGNAHTATVGVTVNSSATLQGIYTINGATQTSANTSYTVTITLKNTTNYKWWNGSTEETITLGTFEIKKAQVSVFFEANPNPHTYSGSAPTITVDVTVPEGTKAPAYTINGYKPSEVVYDETAGTHTVTVVLGDYDNYEWANSDNVVNFNKEFTYTIEQKAATQPTFNGIETESFEETIEVTVNNQTISLSQGPQKDYDGENDIPLSIPQSAEGVNITANDVDVTVTNLNSSVPALLADNGWDLTITEAGTYLITLTLKNGNYSWPINLGDDWVKDSTNANVIYFIYVINEAEVEAPTLSAYENNKTTFTGGAQIPAKLDTFDAVNTSYTVSIEAISGNLTEGKAVNVGEYKLTVTFAEGVNVKNYVWTNLGAWTLNADNTLSYTYEITPQPVGEVDIATLQNALNTMPADGYTYNGNYQLPTLIDGEGYSYAITFTTLDGDKDGTIADDRIGIDAGIYTITLTLDGDNYKWSDTDARTAKTFTYTINRASITFVWKNTSGWTYGQDVNLPKIDVNRSNGGTYAVPVVYAFAASGLDAANGEYELTESYFNSTTAAKTYYVKATVADTDNYVGGTAMLDNGTPTSDDDGFKIKQATPNVTMTPITVTEWYTGLKLSDLTLSGTVAYELADGTTETVTGTFAWVDDAATKLNVMTNTEFNVTFISTNNNYASVTENLTVTITVNPRKITVPTLSGTTSLTYNGATGHTITLTGYDSTYVNVACIGKTFGGADITKGITVNKNNGTITVTEAGNYTVTFTLNYAANCEWLAGNTAPTFTVAKVTNTISGVTVDGWTYDNGETKPEPQLTATSKAGDITYEYRLHGTTGEWLDAPVNAGWYDVKVSIAASDNYFASEETTFYNVFEIEKATVTASLATNSFDYTGSPAAVVVTVKMTDGTTLTNTTDYTSNPQTDVVTNAKLTITLTEAAFVNYAFAGGSQTDTTLSYSITQADNDWTEDPTISDGTTDATYDSNRLAYVVTYSGKAFVGSAVAKFFNNATETDGAAITYAPVSSLTNGVPLNAGTYTITFSVAETDNYKGLSVTISLIIKKVQVTITAPTYTGDLYQNQLVKENGYDYSSAPTVTYTGPDNNIGSFSYGELKFNDAGYGDQRLVAFEGVTNNENAYFELSFGFSDTYKDNYEVIYPEIDEDFLKVYLNLKEVAYIEDVGSYGTIENALAAATQVNGKVTVWVVPDTSGKVVIKENNTIIDSDVTLILPYDTGASNFTQGEMYKATLSAHSGNSDTENHKTAYGTLSELKCVTRVVIDKDVTLIVNGTLEIGGELSGGIGNSAPYSGHTARNYAEIVMKLNAKIIVRDLKTDTDSTAALRCFGFITEVASDITVANYANKHIPSGVIVDETNPSNSGNGSQVVVNSGATLGMPYVVNDFRGGNYMAGLYDVSIGLGGVKINGSQDGIAPFNQFEMRNITSLLTVYYGGSVDGYANLYTQSTTSNNATTVKVIGSTNKCLIQLYENSYLTAKFNVSENDYTATNGNAYCDLHIYGGANTNSIELTISLVDFMGLGSVTLGTDNVYFPLTWRYHITLHDGNYVMNQMFKMMPGCHFTVSVDANLTIAQLNIYENNMFDGVTDAVETGTMTDPYVGGSVKYAANKSDAIFTVNGTLLVKGVADIEGALAGKVHTEVTGAKIEFASSTSASIDAKETINSVWLDGVYSIDTTPNKLELSKYDGGTSYSQAGTYYSYNGGWILDSTKVTVNLGTVDNGLGITTQTKDGAALLEYAITYDFSLVGKEVITYAGSDKTLSFVGWYRDAEGTDKYEGSLLDCLDGDLEITLYAKWTEATTYTVVFNNTSEVDGYKELAYTSDTYFNETDLKENLGTEISNATDVFDNNNESIDKQYCFAYFVYAGTENVYDPNNVQLTKVGNNYELQLTVVWGNKVTIVAGTMSNASVTVNDNDKALSGTTYYMPGDIKFNITYDKSNSKTFKITGGHTYNGSVTTYTCNLAAGVSITVSASSESSSICIVEGTLITLADGTQKKVEDLTSEDQLLVFNHETGQLEVGTLMVNAHADEDYAIYRVMNLKFSDGTTMGLVTAHGLFDLTLNKYAFITEDNMQEYVGHRFYTTKWNGSEFVSGEVILTEAYITEEFTRIYSPVTQIHMNYFAENILNVTGTPFNYGEYNNMFEFDASLKYDEEKMQADIEKYGLYTYEELSEYIPYEVYVGFSLKYMKVSVGKGIITWEEMLQLYEIMLNYV